MSFNVILLLFDTTDAVLLPWDLRTPIILCILWIFVIFVFIKEFKSSLIQVFIDMSKSF